MSAINDRTVHAVLANGTEVVRYDRAGHWYLETVSGTRRKSTLGEAVTLATQPGTTLHPGRSGGQQFNARLRKAQATKA